MTDRNLPDRSIERPLPEHWTDDDPMTLKEIVAVYGRRYPEVGS